ncbi:NADH-quinone oxidoreductase subunit C [Streptomyces tagetis]|uniref:NADH-quinone oxidoreductase subunit C n=1 Tax=Streptomyces tagetis TaxID=2820809 RepID=A0A940XED6_9ACTN|nr:NADH-quinone oxidoreductase subunit C [Streptomyces sp. RG38]MBQ0828768.1 NADH-quinone oxidoreductase subunit C [Streptomyces sp. RG38]
MSAAGWLPEAVTTLFGPEAVAEESYDVLCVDVPAAEWISALETARDRLGCTYFDWLSAVDEPGTGMRVAAHLAALAPVRKLLLRTTVPHEAPVLPTAVGVYAGAGWHERETHEMFGVVFEGHPGLDHLLLPEGFEGHPLRKDFVLAARVAKAWPGAKEPGESEHGGPRRRQMLPPGVPDPNEWGPLKGQLPPATARGAGRTAGERPARRTRSAAEGSTGQTPPAATAPRRTRSASEGSASQTPRRSRSASEGSASQRAAKTEETGKETPTGTGSDTGAGTDTGTGSGAPAPRTAPVVPRSADAPWHHARPAFDEPEAGPDAGPLTGPETGPEAGPETAPEAPPERTDPPAEQPAPAHEPAPADEPGTTTPTPDENRPNPPGGPR